MTEHIIPVKYPNDGVGIAVVFSGLSDTEYKAFELSIDGETYIPTEIDPDNTNVTLPVVFDDLEQKSYKVYGKLITDEDVEIPFEVWTFSEGEVFDEDAYIEWLISHGDSVDLEDDETEILDPDNPPEKIGVILEDVSPTEVIE